jgi:hypothetical protein
MHTDLISVYKVATEIEKVAPITGRLRALAGMYGPVSYRAGDRRRALMVSKTELRRRGILPAELLPSEDHRQIANAVMAALVAELDRTGITSSERIQIIHSFVPALNRLVPADAELPEGISEGEHKEGNTPGVTPR